MKFNAPKDEIIQAYQRKVMEVRVPEGRDPDPAQDRQLQLLSLVAEVLILEATRQMYDREILERVNMVGSYIGEEKMGSADQDMGQWRKESQNMRKAQAEVDKTLSEFCAGYKSETGCKGEEI